MPRYFILATKRVELRGFVRAPDEQSAKQLVKDAWFIYDTSNNSITTGSTSKFTSSPTISEMEDYLKILHIYDDASAIVTIKRPCPVCGVPPNSRCRRADTNKPIAGFHPERELENG